MTPEEQRTLAEMLAELDGQRVRIRFEDGECCALKVVSTTHLFDAGTVIAVPIDGAGVELERMHGIQFSIREVSAVWLWPGEELAFERAG